MLRSFTKNIAPRVGTLASSVARNYYVKPTPEQEKIENSVNRLKNLFIANEEAHTRNNALSSEAKEYGFFAIDKSRGELEGQALKLSKESGVPLNAFGVRFKFNEEAKKLQVEQENAGKTPSFVDRTVNNEGRGR